MPNTPLTDAINALTTYANSVTGKTPPDTTLSDAVATLANGYGGGGGSFETGTIIGDGVISSSYRSIPVSKLYTNFIIYWTDPRQTHESNDVVFAGGTSSIYFATSYNDSGIGTYTTGDYRGVYLKFYDSHIDIQFAVNGGWKKLHTDGTYQWIAW